MDCKKKKYKRVYTSGVLSNSTSAGVQAAQELWVSASNFSKHSATVKVEVFNWGDPAVSAGLTTTPVGMTMPMNAMAMPIMPAEKVKIPCYRTQHFFADLLTGGPLATPVLSFEIRVTVVSADPDDNILFNAVSYAAEPAEPEEPEVPEEEEEEEEEEVEAEAAPVTAAVMTFKDFVLLEME